MTKQIFQVSYYAKDPKTGKHDLLGRAVVDTSNTNDSTYPFMRKCFLQAPEKARHASIVTFEEIKFYTGGKR